MPCRPSGQCRTKEGAGNQVDSVWAGKWKLSSRRRGFGLAVHWQLWAHRLTVQFLVDWGFLGDFLSALFADNLSLFSFRDCT